MATIGQTAKQMKKLFEQSCEKGAQDGEDFIPPSREAFIVNLEQSLGLKTHYTPKGVKYKKLHKDEAEIDLHQAEDLIPSFGFEAIGRDWAKQYEQKFDK